MCEPCQTELLIRNISDTARWAAIYRARESQRLDALFRDPFARRLAGERGEQIVTPLNSVTRTPRPGLRARISSPSSLQISFKRAAI